MHAAPKHRTPLMARLMAVALVFVSTAVIQAQDTKTQTVDAGGVTFEAPSTWKSSKPSSQMRKAQLKVEPVKGDEDPAELIVFAFPGGAGNVDANVSRWQKTFKDKDGNPPKPEVTKIKGKNTDVTRVEMAGHYYPTAFPGQARQPDKEGYRLVAAIVITNDAGYFLRLVGPEKTIASAKPDFDKLIASLKVEEK